MHKMQDKNLKLAISIMSDFIGSNDTKEYTKEVLVDDYGFDEETATELAEAAWKEWVEAYTG
jgi:hypothetical protein